MAELHFSFPILPLRSMTDLSYQTKKVYISKLSAFEEAYHAGEVSVNLDAEPEPDVPDAVPQHSQTHKVCLQASR